MTLYFKNTTLLSIVLIGLLIFSLNAYKLNSNNKTTDLSISVTPYTSSKIPKVFYPIIFQFHIKPKLNNYLDNVLMGCKYHLEQKAKINFNQFGYNSWFTVR